MLDVAMSPFQVFIDVDGVLLGREVGKPGQVRLADGATAFLATALDVSDGQTYWLSTRVKVRDDLPALLRDLGTAGGDEVFLALASRLSVMAWDVMKTEVLPDDGMFMWFDDAPMASEQAFLEAQGWLDRWLHLDTRKRPRDLYVGTAALAHHARGLASGDHARSGRR
jgi:hypothetical protein